VTSGLAISGTFERNHYTKKKATKNTGNSSGMEMIYFHTTWLGLR